MCILWLQESSITAYWCTSIPYIFLIHHHHHLHFMFYTAPPSCPPMSHTTLITGFVISVIQGNFWKTSLLYSFQMVAPVDFVFCDLSYFINFLIVYLMFVLLIQFVMVTQADDALISFVLSFFESSCISLVLYNASGIMIVKKK